MLKIYGAHDSHCDLLKPSEQGVPKTCSCETGKKFNVEMHELAEWHMEAERYANKTMQCIIPENMDPEKWKEWRNRLIEEWKKNNPRVRVSSPPTDDGVVLNNISHPVPPKSDFGKPKIFQFFVEQFPLGMRLIADHMEEGCKDPGHVFLGWQSVEKGFKRYTDAMLRHLLDEVERVLTAADQEEGYDHEYIEIRQAVAVAANAMIRLELLLRKRRNLNLDARARA